MNYRQLDRGYVRDEVGDLSNGCPAYAHVTGPEDTSEAQPRSEYRYDCGWCWLGAPHSRGEHVARCLDAR